MLWPDVTPAQACVCPTVLFLLPGFCVWGAFLRGQPLHCNADWSLRSDPTRAQMATLVAQVCGLAAGGSPLQIAAAVVSPLMMVQV